MDRRFRSEDHADPAGRVFVLASPFGNVGLRDDDAIESGRDRGFGLGLGFAWVVHGRSISVDDTIGIAVDLFELVEALELEPSAIHAVLQGSGDELQDHGVGVEGRLVRLDSVGRDRRVDQGLVQCPDIREQAGEALVDR